MVVGGGPCRCRAQGASGADWGRRPGPGYDRPGVGERGADDGPRRRGWNRRRTDERRPGRAGGRRSSHGWLRRAGACHQGRAQGPEGCPQGGGPSTEGRGEGRTQGRKAARRPNGRPGRPRQRRSARRRRSGRANARRSRRRSSGSRRSTARRQGTPPGSGERMRLSARKPRLTGTRTPKRRHRRARCRQRRAPGRSASVAGCARASWPVAQVARRSRQAACSRRSRGSCARRPNPPPRASCSG